MLNRHWLANNATNMDFKIELVTNKQAEPHLANLIALLQDAVAGGASVGFLPPLNKSDSATYWQSVMAAMQDGSRWLWIASTAGGALAGSVQLDVCMKPNGLHRAEVSKLMVHSNARRQGIASLLMHALEAHARFHDRTTLVLDTRAGDPSEILYQALAWTKIGEIPQYARSADGSLHATASYYKLLC